MRIIVFVLADVLFFFHFQGFCLGLWDFEKFANVFFVFKQVPFDLIFHQDPLFFVGEVERLKWYVQKVEEVLDFLVWGVNLENDFKLVPAKNGWKEAHLGRKHSQGCLFLGGIDVRWERWLGLELIVEDGLAALGDGGVDKMC